jgi:hypothetical protein
MGALLRVKTEMFGAESHHPPEHPQNQMTSNTTIRCTVKKSRSALDDNETLRVVTTNTNYQANFPRREKHMAMVKGKSENYEEHKEIDVTHTDRNMQHVKEESKQKLVTNRRQESGLDKVKRPRSAFDAQENPYTLTTPPPEEPSKNHDVVIKPSPIILPIRSLNPTKLKLPYVQSKEDWTEKLVTSFEGHWYKRVISLENEANHMKKVHKDDSSDSKHLVETVKKERYEVLDETVEFNKVTTETATKEGNAKNEQSLLTTTPTEASGGPNT